MLAYTSSDNKVIGKNSLGWFVAHYVKDVLKHRHYISYEDAIRLLTKWGSSERN